jgi:hypothetical protein
VRYNSRKLNNDPSILPTSQFVGILAVKDLITDFNGVSRSIQSIDSSSLLNSRFNFLAILSYFNLISSNSVLFFYLILSEKPRI